MFICIVILAANISLLILQIKFALNRYKKPISNYNNFFTTKGPNEFLAGSTLKFVAKLREDELISSLLPSIHEVVSHSDVYVRYNAIYALAQLCPHFPQHFREVDKQALEILESESSAECQCMAFKLLAVANKVIFVNLLKYIFTIRRFEKN